MQRRIKASTVSINAESFSRLTLLSSHYLLTSWSWQSDRLLPGERQMNISRNQFGVISVLWCIITDAPAITQVDTLIQAVSGLWTQDRLHFNHTKKLAVLCISGACKQDYRELSKGVILRCRGGCFRSFTNKFNNRY